MKDTFRKLPEEKQTQIFNAALKIFAEKGYYQANVADICDEAGISNGALYKYFKNKEALYASCIDLGIDLMAREIFSEGLSEDQPFYERIQKLLENAALFSERHPNVVALYLELGCVFHNRFSELMSTQIENRARDFHLEQVKRAVEKGEIRAKVDPDIAAYIIDNNLMIFAFSIISEHYNQRFRSYFGNHAGLLDVDRKIEIIMKSIRQLLSG